MSEQQAKEPYLYAWIVCLPEQVCEVQQISALTSKVDLKTLNCKHFKCNAYNHNSKIIELDVYVKNIQNLLYICNIQIYISKRQDDSLKHYEYQIRLEVEEKRTLRKIFKHQLLSNLSNLSQNS